MKLHHDIKLFSDTLRAASQHLDIKLEFVEKDYWITLVLSRLAKNKYVDESVFKGGTSLSKGYNLIKRFSEDVDIAIINDKGKTGNEIKTIIRTIEKEITSDLTEVQMDGVTSKGSRIRKSVFEYVTTDKSNKNNKLIVEINSFANPFPFQRLSLKSFVFDFLQQTGNEKYIEQYDLQPFEVNVLSKEQTLLEKTISLIRFSFEQKAVETISKKIRHFYDLYFLMKNPECAEFVSSDSFKKQFETILQHDREMFEEPIGWQTKLISESPLVADFPAIWEQLKEKYQTELSALAYRTIPAENEVAKWFKEFIKRIE
ncbi:MAG TPA: nucleotidyl transferase AbiEii/AbiGii toxin family protein [Bacteroidales bacterium]|nr:nucleotidyl transferase AbiEii/AbiGii toxin family protein [Bacteroidales bacterium]HQH24147.1 nucleotidyl transferase AbiEii/AbiGii toxin family protein [Bacteroidales bacterium]HQJ81772.1 nucleotidyl transferase AbiEii/AbiGii toxin family protein [Bacteroidales bacterium]